MLLNPPVPRWLGHTPVVPWVNCSLTFFTPVIGQPELLLPSLLPVYIPGIQKQNPLVRFAFFLALILNYYIAYLNAAVDPKLWQFEARFPAAVILEDRVEKGRYNGHWSAQACDLKSSGSSAGLSKSYGHYSLFSPLPPPAQLMSIHSIPRLSVPSEQV